MWRYFFTHELRRPLWAAVLASIVAVALLVSRIVLTHRVSHLFLAWNLFLAWIPVLLALRAEQLEEQDPPARWQFRITALAWLLFFPNAPYIFTDLTHLKPVVHSRWWSDLIVILYFAFVGLMLAFISLHRMQCVVCRRRGWAAGWMFVFAVAFVTGFGVYLGRFERWNTWDVLLNPISLVGDSVHWLSRHSVKFTVLFGVFLLSAYGLLYSLTSLAPREGRTRATRELE